MKLIIFKEIIFYIKNYYCDTIDCYINNDFKNVFRKI